MLFDTECVLCSRTVRFILAHERDRVIRFAGSTSAAGQALAARHGLTPDDLDRSFAVIDGDRVLLRSDASIELARHLRAPWRWLGLVRVAPRPLRDAAYTAIATRRYRLFGRLDTCFVPPVAMRDRFLDLAPG